MKLPTINHTDNLDLRVALERRINFKTKPQGSLGRLEALALQIGLAQGSIEPRLIAPTFVVFAGDHGVTAEGVSAYPQSVTWQMVENFLAGGAAINVFARQHGLALHIVDAGVNHDFGERTGLIDRKIAMGTANFAQVPALSAQQCSAAIEAGFEVVRGLDGNVLGLGEMGIGNTSSAAAIMHCVTGLPLEQCTGAGTGLDTAGIERKRSVIAKAVALHGAGGDPATILACYGGFEIAMMVGAMLEAASRRMVILIDGFIVTSALLVAAALAPQVLDYCVFSHASDELGHRRMLDYLGVKPLLQMDLRLGEGSGAALAYPLLESAVRFLNDMATFESAGVSEKSS